MSQQAQSNREYWQTQLKCWEESGLTAAHWCRENSVTYSQFTYWRHRLQKPVNSTGFLEVASESNDSGIVLQIGSVSIQVQPDFSEAILIRLLNALRRVS